MFLAIKVDQLVWGQVVETGLCLCTVRFRIDKIYTYNIVRMICRQAEMDFTYDVCFNAAGNTFLGLITCIPELGNEVTESIVSIFWNRKRST